MQHTETYKLNLIETSDTFSPDALNENAQKVERELTRLDGADAALEARVTTLEVQKIFFGTVAYERSPQTVNLGFTPVAVLVLGRIPGTTVAMAVGEKYVYHVSGGQETALLKIVENGFTITSLGSTFFAYGEHNYIAFA